MMLTDHTTLWQAVVSRDRRWDGQFVYAVATTGIYCRPTCPSRRPAPSRVSFFASSLDAQQAGYRACLRCHPHREDDGAASAVGRARRYLDAHAGETVSLARLAAHVGLSPAHLQRTFSKTVGVSPRAYLAARRMEHFRRELRGGSDVTTAVYEVGFGSPSRIYERADAELGMTPATYGAGGAGASIRWSVHQVSLGLVLIATTERGVCAVSLGDGERALIEALLKEFPRASIQPAAGDHAWAAEIIRRVEGCPPAARLPLDLRATTFQWRVWRALSAIPTGETRTYSQIAAAAGRPTAARAAARACASNRVAVVVPCHRAVPRDGSPGGYRWGPALKRRLLGRETAPAEPDGQTSARLRD
jgi:AraC family transcriptional regulator, regulatory protein of adaptative response / methylated-DNA-[protein]-cysteine methyltransferase